MSNNDSFQTTQVTSWFARMKNVFGGFIVGIILFIGSIFLLIWNEKHSVETYKSLVEGQKLVHTVPSTTIDPNNNGKLVHVLGPVTTQDILADPSFNVSLNAIKLKRNVEMYQWRENQHSKTEHNTGGSTSTTTTYTYEKIWSSNPINSSQFKEPTGHQNPTEWPYRSMSWQAKIVTLDAFFLNGNQISRIDNFRPLSVNVRSLPPNLINEVKSYDYGYYLGSNPTLPQIGDLKIQYSTVKPCDITIIATQTDNTFEPFHAHAGGTIDMLEIGKYSSEDMFTKAFEKNELMTWGIRLAGFIAMWIGLYCISQPIVVLADVLPLFGAIVAMGMGLLSFIIAFSLSLIVIGFAWVAYHPLVGSTLLLLGLAIIVGGLISRKNKIGNNQVIPNNQTTK